MGRSLTGLENPGRILSGFNGASTTSLGDIVLPVQAGPVTLNVQFSVVQDLSPFNVILGRTWLHYMKAILYISSSVSRSPMLPDSTRTRPVRQRVRRFHPDRQKVIRDEIDKLLEAGFIREVEYPDWLANVVVVPKKEGKWRVCVDYTNLNNACPKDSFPLPRMLSFLDAFSGYHQIPMSPADEEKTAFITLHDLYCYKVMPFGLKNTGATYQRLMTKIFKPLVGRTIEYDMKLNPSKCAFGVSLGNSRDLCKKELRLTCKLVALGRFIARFTDELRPFFLAIRKAGANEWTDSCQSAFEKIKHCLMQPPILSSPLPEEKLYMYLAVSEWAISAVLFRCPSPKEQKPIYYVSRAPPNGRANRPTPSQHSAQTGPNRKNASMGHRVKRIWNRVPTQLSMKGQVMADFVLEYSRRPIQRKEPSEKEWWTLRVDGASRSSGSGNIWSKPSDWGSPPLTMKRNMRPSYPDWTSPWLYPSPSSGSIVTPNSW
ncbi:hypothetical protein AAG906_000512 [Vitis piasezkii]